MSEEELRELDAEVARKVFGWDVAWLTDALGRNPFAYDRTAKRHPDGSSQASMIGGSWQRGRLDTGEDVVLYGRWVHAVSALIGPAWEVVKEMRKQGWRDFSLAIDDDIPGQSWRAMFSNGNRSYGQGETAPLAICRAAIEAKCRE